MNPTHILALIINCIIWVPLGWIILGMLKRWAAASYFDRVANPMQNLSSFLPSFVQDQIGRINNRQPLVAPPGVDLPAEVEYTTTFLFGKVAVPHSCSAFRWAFRGSFIGSNGPVWIVLIAYAISLMANGGWVTWGANFVIVGALAAMLLEFMPYIVPVTVAAAVVWMGWVAHLCGGFHPSVGWIVAGVVAGPMLLVLVNWIYLWPLVGKWIGMKGSCIPNHGQLEEAEQTHCANYTKWMVMVPWCCLAGPLAIYPAARAAISFFKLLFAFRRNGIPSGEIMWFGGNYIFFGIYVAGTSFVRWFNQLPWRNIYLCLFILVMICTIIGCLLIPLFLKNVEKNKPQLF